MLKKKKYVLEPKEPCLFAGHVCGKSVNYVRSKENVYCTNVPSKGAARGSKKKRAVRRNRSVKPAQPFVPATPTDPNPDSAYSQGYNEAYNEGFNAGFAKGFEDGHQLAYKAQ